MSNYLLDRVLFSLAGSAMKDIDSIDSSFDFMSSLSTEDVELSSLICSGVEVSFMISEINQNKFRINFRSRGKYIINDIAQYFNGGGHKLAAGATVENTTIDKLENKIFKMLQDKKELLCQ